MVALGQIRVPHGGTGGHLGGMKVNLAEEHQALEVHTS
jgi:hypothetical protein